jgi:hypothetical protein
MTLPGVEEPDKHAVLEQQLLELQEQLRVLVNMVEQTHTRLVRTESRLVEFIKRNTPAV